MRKRKVQSEKRKDKGITLIELIIAITLVGMVALTAGTVEIWSRRMGTVQDKQAELLNRISPVMEHIVKNVYTGIGYKDNPTVALRVEPGVGIILEIKHDVASPFGEFTNTDEVGRYVYTNNNKQLRFMRVSPNQVGVIEDTVLARDVELQVEPVLVDYNNNGNTNDDTPLVYQLTLRTRQNINDPNPHPINNPEVSLTTNVACREQSIS
ncbi:MAG: prepilin-type N-terminal cleavage/methylation domain-containing protein [Candidatus Omnitrophota bacterium]